ncbi:MAG: HEAT repeat domain-containing protein [Nitrospirae bacterium]|nr:HEAT repeat domain-containing protein [Nitrospirota bacterium]
MTTKDIIAAIATGSEMEAFEAAKDLIKTESHDATPQLVQILETATQDYNKRAAAYALSWLEGDNQALEALITALSKANLNDSVRGQAAEGIGLHNPPANHSLRKKAVAAIIQGLTDSSPVVRFWSCYAAGTIKLKEALAILTELNIKDKTPCPGWWYISEEAEDAIEWIHNRKGKERIPIHDRKA